MEIKFYNTGTIENFRYHFAVICSSYRGKWVFVKNRERNTWEIPGGHREANEDINTTASRELYEETGAADFSIEPVNDYSVTIGETVTFGRLFYAGIAGLGPLPESEISEIILFKELPGMDELTYPEIQPVLQKRVLEYLSKKVSIQLEKDKNRNINMINFLKSYPAYSFDTVGGSVLARGRSDEEWVYISSTSGDEFGRLIKGLDDDDKCFAVLEDWMLPDIVKDRKVRSRLTSMKLVYDGKTPLPPVKSNIIKLQAGDAEYIYRNSKYQEYISVEYIEERINNGIGLGIYKGGRLAAWALTHDDGAIGFLNVVEECRQNGYGTDVTIAMIRNLLELGAVPFVHIEEENIKSMNLALRSGFRRERRIHWIKLD